MLAGLYADWHILSRSTEKGQAVKNRLSERDYVQLLGCIEAIHQCKSLEDFPRAILAELRKLIDCNLAGYNEVNLPRNRAVILLDPPWTDEGTIQLQHNFAKVMHEHPVISYFNETGDGQTLKISDFITAREFRSLAIYRDVYRGMNVGDQISFAVKVEHGFIIGIAFNRSDRSFTEKDRLRLNLVRPHIIQAYLHAAEIAGHTEQKRDLEMALRENGVGVIALSGNGSLVHATPGTFECIARYIPIPEDVKSGLPSNIMQWACDTNGKESAAGPFVSSGDPGRLIIRRVRHEDRIILLLSEETKPGGSGQLARYQLTPREAEVLRWVAEGKANAEIATILGLTAGTVKLHVERILAKLGVENRTMAALAAQGVN